VAGGAVEAAANALRSGAAAALLGDADGDANGDEGCARVARRLATAPPHGLAWPGLPWHALA